MLFLTGPNMAGKTTYLRSCGIALYLAHLGMGVPARSFRFSPCQRMFTSISVHDNVRSGVSFFRAEALRVKAIAQSLSEGFRVVALLDEPFMGTNLKDALDASRAILESFAHKEGSVFLVSSHLIELGDHMIATGRVDCQHFEAHEHEGRLRFEYLLRPGVSTQRLGMRVLREEGIFMLLEGEGNGTTGATRVAAT
jgi:DNA mismatch repair ATPase MutS